MFRLDVYHHFDDAALGHRLDVFEALLRQVLTKEDSMGQELDDLRTQVAETVGIEQSAITLINGIAQKLADAIAAGDPAALTALHDSLKTSADALAADVTANQPPAPPAA